MKRVLKYARYVVLFLAVWGTRGSLHAQDLQPVKEIHKATFAAGCFWGVEKVFSQLTGVVATRVGYTGGRTEAPSYEEVCSGRTGHAEAVEIEYDPARIRYEDLLEVFWTHHDPTTRDRQGPDRGTQYRSAIFYHDEAQKQAAEKSIKLLDESKVLRSRIVTEVVPAAPFWTAEEYHQKYLQKNPDGYCSLQLQPKKISQILKTGTHS